MEGDGGYTAVLVRMAGRFPEGAWLPLPPLQEAKVTEEDRGPGQPEGHLVTAWPPAALTWPLK